METPVDTTASKKNTDNTNNGLTDTTTSLDRPQPILDKDKTYTNRLPWGATKEKSTSIYNKSLLLKLKSNTINFDASLSSSGASTLSASCVSDTAANESTVPKDFWATEKQKPGEYVMHLVMLNFIQQSSKKFDQIISGERRDKRLKDSIQSKTDDVQLDQLVQTMGQLAEKCLPSLVRSLLIWYESQMSNLNYLKQQQQLVYKQYIEAAQSSNASTKTILKVKQQLLQQKLENELLDERKELVIHAILCIFLVEILKQLPFHPGNDDLLGYIIDLSFKRFLCKDM